jgi:hypothetical protein
MSRFELFETPRLAPYQTEVEARHQCRRLQRKQSRRYGYVLMGAVAKDEKNGFNGVHRDWCACYPKMVARCMTRGKNVREPS